MMTSLTNPQVKNLVKLRKSQRHRREQGLMVIEGLRELQRALQTNTPLQIVYYCPECWYKGGEQALLEELKRANIETRETGKPVFEKISYRSTPDGLLATAPLPVRRLEDLQLSENPFIIVAEALEKPGNLGSLLRLADAAGADALIVCDQATDINNPNVIRASTGTIFSVPIAECSSEEAIKWLKSHRIKILSSSPAAKIAYTAANLTQACAIIIGSEQAGLDKKWMKEADIQVTIPMHGLADSLNASMAATVLAFETIRQRNRGP